MSELYIRDEGFFDSFLMNELILMKRESFDELRGNGRLEKFLYSLSNEVLDSLLFMGCVFNFDLYNALTVHTAGTRRYNIWFTIYP